MGKMKTLLKLGAQAAVGAATRTQSNYQGQASAGSIDGGATYIPTGTSTSASSYMPPPIISGNPQENEYQSLDAQEACQKGAHLFVSGDLQGSVPYLRVAVSKGSTDAWGLLYSVLLRMGDERSTSEADKILDEMIKANIPMALEFRDALEQPSSSFGKATGDPARDAYYKGLRIRNSNGDMAQAATLFRRAANGQLPDAMYAYALCLIEFGNKDEAEKWLKWAGKCGFPVDQTLIQLAQGKLGTSQNSLGAIGTAQSFGPSADQILIESAKAKVSGAQSTLGSSGSDQSSPSSAHQAMIEQMKINGQAERNAMTLQTALAMSRMSMQTAAASMNSSMAAADAFTFDSCNCRRYGCRRCY